MEQLWTAAQQAGPFGCMLVLFLWWRSDTERQKVQKEYNNLLRETLNGLSAATAAVGELSRIVRPHK